MFDVKIHLHLSKYDKIGLLFPLLYTVSLIIRIIFQEQSLEHVIHWEIEREAELGNILSLLYKEELVYYALCGVILVSVIFLVMQYCNIQKKSFSFQKCLMVLGLTVLLLSPCILVATRK
jgi:hypothetical protein